jgi:dipeptidyl aminopeptidase/acylaminoacyl peptidase
MTSLRLLSIPALILALPVAASPKRAFAIEDLYRLKGVQHLALSPDGSKLAFEVSSQDLKAATRNTQIWMLDTVTGATKQLTFSGKADTAPQWSKDGKTLYFLSSRAEGSQLWALDLAGGEARKVTAFEAGVGSPKVMPGGNQVVFQATVFPEAMADGAKQKELAEKLEKGPVQAHLADTLLYRHWTEWRDFQYSHLFTATFDGKVAALTSGKQDYPADATTPSSQSFDLSPDGREVCVVTNTDPVPARSTNQDLFLISLDGDRTPRRITDNPAYDGDPKYSPDGRYLAYKFQTRPAVESDRFRLAVYDRQTKTRKVLTEAIDNWVDAFQWSDDGKAIWFTVQEKGRWPLFRVDVATGKTTRILDGQSIREFVVSPDQKAVYLSKTRVGEPVEVWRYAFGTKELKRLTAFNQAVADEVDIRPAEEQWVKGADGKDIQVFLVKPHGFDPAKKYPLILNVHGGPQMMWSDTLRGDWQVYPGAGYIVAFPNPHGLRPGLHGCHQRRLGRQGDDGHREGGRPPGGAALRGQGPHGRHGLELGRLRHDVAGGPHHALQGHRRHDGRLRPALHARCHRGAVVPRARPHGHALGQGRRLRPHEPKQSCEGLQDALPRHHRRAGLPRALHPEPAVLHGAPGDGRAQPPDRLQERRPLARRPEVHARLLQRPPRVVPEVPGRRRGSLEDRGHGAQPGVRRRREVASGHPPEIPCVDWPRLP